VDVRYALGATYTSQSPALIPVDAFTPSNGNGHGLLAEYFDNPEMQGQAKVSRVEPRPLIQGGVLDAAVKAALPQRGFAIRWTGTLHPPVTGDYTITPSGGGRQAIRIFLDEKELVPDASAPAPGRGAPAQLHTSLEAGHGYAVRIEYRPQGNLPPAVQISWLPPAEPLLAQAVDAVKAADVAVAFLGLNPNLEGEEMRVNIPGFAGGDRTDLNLPEPQEKLIEAAMGTGKPVVVVLTSGSALAANKVAERAAAVLELWYGGEEAGTAIAETLAGANNPAGRLPVTFYRGVDQLPPFDDYSMNGRTYRYFKGDPLYGFGFGLSYSKFQYSGLKAQRTAKGAEVSVRVKNDSPREGDEVVQLYVTGDDGSEAIRQLRGFQRVHLRAGESRDVRFTLAPQDLPKGKATISVGSGQPVGKVPRVEGTL
jgi:beta-glucosidase